jgi:hypothetical protein
VAIVDDVFISYARSDHERAGRLAAVLEAQGWTVWWDREIPPGATFDEHIEKALAGARCVIVLWSAESVTSRWVRTEASVASERGVLVPALIEPVTPPLEFRQIQAADLAEWSGDADDPQFKSIVERIALLAKTPPAAGSVPVPRRAHRGPSAALTLVATALVSLLVGAGLMYVFQRVAPKDGAQPTAQSRPPDDTPAASASARRQPATSSADAGGRIDILAAANGGHLVRAPHENWNQPIDGSENWEYISGQEAVYGFAGDAPATFDTFRMLITESRDWNIKGFELLVANMPQGPFRSIGTFETQNVRLFPSPWQDFTFASTRARYLKVRVLTLHKPSGATQVEQWQLLGHLSSGDPESSHGTTRQ